MTTALICIFIAGYLLIAMESWTRINKTAVSLLMAVISWVLYYWGFGSSSGNVSAFTHALGETSEILFFLLGAMVIVEVVDTNGGFDFFREKLISKTKVALLWKLTLCTFFLSAVLDNMTTAIIMVMILDKLVSDKKDKMLYASMVILAANSGGAFSPIGDVTTIMLWVKGHISTFGVIRSLFLPSLVSVILPAVIVSFFLKGKLSVPRRTMEHLTVNHGTVSATHYGAGLPLTKRESILIFCIGVGGLLFVPVFRFVAGCMGMYDVVASGPDIALYGIDGTFWELLAYTGGIGGSMLIIGSAAGVVVMGLQKISFTWYLRHFSWIACLGFLAGIIAYWIQGIL